MANDVHDQMIRDRELKIDLLKAEIKVLREAQALANQGKNGKPSERELSTRDRPLNETWSNMLRHIGDVGQATFSDLIKFSELRGYHINKNTLRGQVFNYVKRGWLERVEDGVFSLTNSGAEKCNYDPLA